MVVFRNFEAIDSQPNQPSNQTASKAHVQLHFQHNCDYYYSMRTLAHAIYLNIYIIYSFPPLSIYSSLFFVLCAVSFLLCCGILHRFFVFIFFDQDNLKTFFFRLTSNDDNFEAAHFQLKCVLYIRFNGAFCVSRSIHFKCFPPFEITYISKYRFTFRLCRIVLSLYPYLLNVILSIYFMGEFRRETDRFSIRCVFPLLLFSD